MLTMQNINIPGLEPISFKVDAGECVGVSGDSGCGKTRLLRAIADMDVCDGKVCIDELCQQELAGHEWRKTVCLLPAESQWWFDTVEPHFSDTDVGFSQLGFETEVRQWQLARCSSGEKQRLAILRMLANKPRVLLLDEPTANLDAENTDKVESLITDYLANNNAMAIWVSHNHAQLRRVSTDKHFDLSEGRLDRVIE
jgi:ABC-type iron transport system FetAB ATPase subunit